MHQLFLFFLNWKTEEEFASCILKIKGKTLVVINIEIAKDSDLRKREDERMFVIWELK